VLVPWTPLQPSRRELRWRRVGAAVAGAGALALGYAALRAATFDPRLAAVAIGASVVAALALRVRRGAFEVGVDVGGRPVVRRLAGGTADGQLRRARCLYAAPWLITLGSATNYITIWPDSVPQDTYRRLWVCVRWGTRGAAGDSAATITHDT
jgi:hypothetical protein